MWDIRVHPNNMKELQAAKINGRLKIKMFIRHNHVCPMFLPTFSSR